MAKQIRQYTGSGPVGQAVTVLAPEGEVRHVRLYLSDTEQAVDLFIEADPTDEPVEQYLQVFKPGDVVDDRGTFIGSAESGEYVRFLFDVRAVV